MANEITKLEDREDSEKNMTEEDLEYLEDLENIEDLDNLDKNESRNALVPITNGGMFTDIEVRDLPNHIIPDVIHLLPLRDAVIFPKLVAPIAVGRDPFVKLIDDAVVGGNRILGIVTQKLPETENPTLDEIYGTGTIVAIRMMGKQNDVTKLLVEGVQRFTIREIVQSEPYLKAKVDLLDEEAMVDLADPMEVEARKRELERLFHQIVDMTPDMPDDLKGLSNLDTPSIMTDLMASHVGRLTTEERVDILETFPLTQRMDKLIAYFTREVQVLDLGMNLHNQVAGEMGRHQREYFLREQMKVIQKELGDNDDRANDVDELRQKLEAAGLSEEARKEADRELERLKRMAPGSPEHGIVRNYLELMANLPWNTSSTDNLDIKSVKEILDADHYGLEKIKDRILEYLSVRAYKKGDTARQPILCLVGPPGVGKTSLGRSMARALGKKFHRLALGGVRDEAEIRGHRRTYMGAMPGQILQALKRAETNNPLIMLDEVDKISSDFRGDPSSALLEVLNPEQNNTFRDNYLDVPFDLSKVLFVTTANSLETIQPALRDRMEIIELSGYTEQEKVAIAKQHLVPKQLGEHGLDSEQVVITDDALVALVQGYTREAGVRNLERQIASLLRKVTREFAEGTRTSVVVDRAQVASYLGSPRFEYEELEETNDTPGVVTGLVWTPVGGDVISIEAQKMAGTRTLQLTGQLGDVMQESVKIALSYVRAHAPDLGVDPKFWEHSEIHVHVPAGATPKDGPSAGVTMTTALVSLLTGRKVRLKLAMTGEVTLTGKVLPVGGIKEKVLAAKRAGVTTVILPDRNRKDLEEDIPAELREGMEFIFAKSVRDVLDVALAPPSGRKALVRGASIKPRQEAIPQMPLDVDIVEIRPTPPAASA